MAFTLEHLDAATRRLMLAELDADLAAGRQYIDPRLAAGAAAPYLKLLQAALQTGTPESFTRQLERSHLLLGHEERRLPTGGSIHARLPINAAQTIAEGEFNRYYLRAVCLLALQAKVKVEVYRAKPVKTPRPEEDRLRDAGEMLAHLRSTNISVSSSFPGPNSGRSLRLAKAKP